MRLSNESGNIHLVLTIEILHRTTGKVSFVVHLSFLLLPLETDDVAPWIILHTGHRILHKNDTANSIKVVLAEA